MLVQIRILFCKTFREKTQAPKIKDIKFGHIIWKFARVRINII